MDIIVVGTKGIGHLNIFVQSKTFYIPFHTVNQIAFLDISQKCTIPTMALAALWGTI